MQTNLDTAFKANSALEQDGVDFRINDTTTFRLRRFSASNTRVKAAMAKHHKPYARQMEMGTLDQKKSVEINTKVFIDACLVSWQGVEVDGKPLECTKENALKLFLGLPDLVDSLFNYASDFSSYKDDVGNS